MNRLTREKAIDKLYAEKCREVAGVKKAQRWLPEPYQAEKGAEE